MRSGLIFFISAHILGECMERYFGGALCYGPPIEDGFYYDMWMGERTVSEKEDIPKLEKLYAQMIKEKQPFQRLEVTGEQLREMFKHNPFKQRLIQERNIGDTTVYRCGNLIDMCRGPHLPHTGKAKSVSLYKTSATYWEGNAEEESLQRIYGITFPGNWLQKIIFSLIKSTFSSERPSRSTSEPWNYL